MEAMHANFPNMKVMGIVMMETIMLVVTMTEVIAALVIIHYLDGISIALFVNVLKVNKQSYFGIIFHY